MTIEVTGDRDREESERLRRLNALFVGWRNQQKLDKIFDIIDKERHEYRGIKLDEI